MSAIQFTQTFPPVKVVEIELSHPIRDIENLDSYLEMKALVRLHGVPLGFIQLSVSDGCCAATAITKEILRRHSWAIIRHLISDGIASPLQMDGLDLSKLIEVEHPKYIGPTPLVTVAVCTRDRIEELAACLEAIYRIDYPNLEILVVDNAPSNDAAKQLIQTLFPSARYFHEPRQGLSWARNRAIAEANGEIIAFTDDDAMVDPGWIWSIVKAFVENPGAMCVTGLVAPYELETEAQILFEYYGGFTRGFERQWYQFDAEKSSPSLFYHGTGKFGTGANMAFRLKLFRQIGLFDPALGVGTVTGGGEDLEMFFRLLYEGYILIYEPNALVYHRHRRDYAGLKKQIFNNGVALSSFQMCGAMNYPGQRLAFLKLQLLWFFQRQFRQVVKAFTRPWRYPQDLVLAELSGYLTGINRYQIALHNAEELSKQFGPIRINKNPLSERDQPKSLSPSIDPFYEAEKQSTADLV